MLPGVKLRRWARVSHYCIKEIKVRECSEKNSEKKNLCTIFHYNGGAQLL